MNIIKMGWLVVSICIVMAITVGRAKAAGADREPDHVALRALRDKVVAAIDNQDIKSLSSCFAKEFAFTPVTQTLITNSAQMNEFYDRMFHSKDAIVTSVKTEPKADILTRFTDENTGICYGTSKETYAMKAGDIVSMNVRWTATVVKENGEWKVAAAHVGTDFLDNPVLARVASFWKKAALAGSCGGLLLGVLVGGLVLRRKPAA